MAPPDVRFDGQPTAEEAASLLRSWSERRGAAESTQVAISGVLHPTEATAFLAALDECKAQTTSYQAQAEFGDVPPFTNVAEAEGRHIDGFRGAGQRRHRAGEQRDLGRPGGHEPTLLPPGRLVPGSRRVSAYPASSWATKGRWTPTPVVAR